MALWSTDTMGDFDEELLVERIKVMNLVQVEFVVRSGVEVV